MTSSIIKYRINSVTSESPQYPASNLTDLSSSFGWQSDFSPSYPQEISLQFFTPIRTKTLKLTFHQYKIPTLVEVFVRLTAKQNYRKLGFIVPNDNSQSSFEHKEIKTLYFEFPCNYIKLVFYQSYKNEMNLFQQVALQDLKIEGQAMTYNQIKNIDLTQQASSADQSQSGQMQINQYSQQGNRPKLFPIDNSNLIQTAGMEDLNNRFSEVYSYLQNKKSQAVQKQDFRLAGYLKNVIQTFKTNQTEIASLQIQKKQALEEEDFDKCHRIKLQIQKLKEQFQYRLEQLYQNEENFMAEYSHSRILPDPQRLTERKPMQPQNKGDMKTDGIKNFVSSTPEREYETSLGKNKSGQQRQQQQKKLSLNLNANNNREFGANNSSAVSQNKSINSEKVVDHNQQIIPAVRNKMLGIKQQNEQEYPTNRSMYEESKNYSSVGRVSSRGNLQRKPEDKSPKAIQNGVKSPPKSPTRKVVTKKAQTYVSVVESDASLKEPILSYQSLQYRQQTQIKQQTFSPSSKKKMAPQQSQKQQQFEALLDRLKRLQVQPLDLKLRMKLQSHFTIIQEPYWQMIMHKSWSVKKQGLEHVRDDVNIDSKQAYMAVMEFISFSINDPHPQVLLATLSILRKLIQEGNNNGVEFTLPHMPYFIETIVNALLNLINSTNKQLSEQAYNLYLMLGMIGFLTIQYLVQKLIKHKQTTKVTPQYTVMKISLMISLIEKYQQTTKYFKDILLWSIEFLKDPNNKVRSQASYVLLILVDVVGEDKVINVLKDKPQMMELYLQILNNSQLIQNSRVDSLSNLGDGSRFIDKNQSKFQDNNSSWVQNPKSVSKQRAHMRNKSQLSQNQSGLAKNKSQQEQKQTQSSKRLKNPWTSSSNTQTKQQKPNKSNNNSRSKISSERNDDQLEYSKESDFYSSSIKKQNPSNMYANRGYSQSELSQNVLDRTDGEMRVMQEQVQSYGKQYGKYHHEKRHLEDQQQEHEKDHSHQQQSRNYQEYYQEENDQDSDKCDYCFMDMRGMDQRQHLLTECKVLISCQECMGRVYIRETIYHLLNQCTNHTYHQQCKKCGLVFNIDEINEHVGQGLCRLQRGEGWERCQFCGQDVMANDMKWVDHAYKCPNLPQPPEITEKQSQFAD